MKNKNKGIIIALLVSLSSCTNLVPTKNQELLNSQTNLNSYFKDLDKEYNFSVKELLESYLSRKINKWITENNGDKLLKELLYAQFKQPTLMRNVVKNSDNPGSLYNQITGFSQVSQRMGFDPSFSAFILSLSPSKGEYLVNEYTAGLQWTPAIATDFNGDFVIAWTTNQLGNRNEVYARRYDSTGNVLTSEFRVNTTITNSQELPAVAMDHDGDFVITWAAYYQDGEGSGIYAQRYDSTGATAGTEFKINQLTTGYQFNSSVAMDHDGNFVVTWVTTNLNQDGNGWGIIGRLFDKNGNPQTGDFVVNSTTSGNQEESAVAMDAAGNFVAVWKSPVAGASSYDIFARKFNNLGVPQGNDFRVNNFTTSAQQGPAVAMDQSGDFLISWVGSGDSGYGVYAKKYNSSLGVTVPDFRADSGISGGQDPSLAMDSSGNFIVSWEEWLSDGDNDGVRAKIFDPNGSVIASEFTVNTVTTGGQLDPTVAVDGSGRFVFAWDSIGQDGDSYGVFGKRLSSSGNEL